MRAFRPKDIFHLRRLQDVAIAPDGEAIAYCLAQPDPGQDRYTTRIVRLPSEDRTPQFLTRGPADRRPWFSPDGRYLAFLRPAGEGDQVHLLPLRGGEALQLTGLRHGVEAYAWGPHGRRIAVVTAVGPTGQTGRQLFHFDLDGTWRQLSDDEFDHVDPIFSPDGRSIACVLRRRTKGVLECAIAMVASDGGHWRILTQWQTAWARPVFPADGGGLYAIGDAAGQGSALWRIPLDDSPPVPLATPPWPGALASYLGDEGRPDRDLFVTADGQALLGLLSRRDSAVIGRLVLPAGRWQIEGEPWRRVLSFAATAAGSRTALIAGEADQPPEAVLRDDNGQVLLRSGHHELFLSDVSFRPREPIGDPEAGAGILMPDRPGDPPALAVVLGEAPDAATGRRSSLLEQALVGSGLAVLSLPLGQPRLGESRVDPEQLLAQVDAALDLLGKGVDRERIGLLGQGPGGYLALLLLTRTQRFRACATLGAATDLIGLYGHGGVEEAAGIGPLPPPWQVPASYLELSPIAHADRIGTPLLLLHGEDDKVVPMQQALALGRALESAGRSVRIEILPGLGHRSIDGAPLRMQAQLLETMVGWLGDHLAR